MSDLHAKLQLVDQVAAQKIRPGDRVRIERALEVHALSGRKLSELQREHGFAESRYEATTLFLDPPRELLHDRIARRTRQLFASGDLKAETEWLLARGGSPKALKIIGYGEMAEALRTGRFDEAEERVNARTRQYAKRQRSWFAKEAAPLAWPFDAESLSERARRWYEGAAQERTAPGGGVRSTEQE